MKKTILVKSLNCCDMYIHRLCNRLMIFLVFLSFASTIWAQGVGAGKFAEAEKARKAKDLVNAIKLYDEAIKLEPNNSKYWYRKGQAQMSMRRDEEYDNAIQSFIKATEYNPGLTSAYVNIYKLYAKKKDANNAIKYLKLAYEKETDQTRKVQYKVISAKYYLSQEKPQEALRELQDAKVLSPTDMQVLYTEGEINGKQGNWTQALDSYNKALEAAKKAYPNSPDKQGKFKVGVGLSYHKLGKTAEYQKIYDELNSSPQTRIYANRLKKLIKGDSDSLPIRLATAYMKASEFDEAKKYANQAVSGNNPGQLATAYKVLGLIHTQAGEPNLAVTAFGKAAAEEKDEKKRAQIYNTMVKLQFRNNDYQGALQTANKILEKGPNVNIMFLKAQSEYKLGKYNDCVSTTEQVITKLKSGNNPPSGSAMAKYYFQLGLAAKKANQVGKAKEAFKNAQYGVFRQAAANEAKALSAN